MMRVDLGLVVLSACVVLAGCPVESSELRDVASQGAAGQGAAGQGAMIGDDDDAVATTSALLSGSSPGTGCYERESWTLQQAMILGRTLGRTNALQECIDRAVRSEVATPEWSTPTIGPYLSCPGDFDELFSVADKATLLKGTAITQNQVRLTCADYRRAGEATIGSYGHGGDENIGLDWDFIEDTHTVMSDSSASFRDRSFALEDMAGLIWHEAVHTQGYSDDCLLRNYQTQPESQAATYIVQACMHEVWQRSMAICNPSACTSQGARIPLIASFDSKVCVCMRDEAAEDGELSQPIPASPNFGTYALPRVSPWLRGNQLGDFYGYALASGDFNGDGFSDLAVGAPGKNGNMGVVYLYVGTVYGLYPYDVRGAQTTNPGLLPVPGTFFGFSLASGDFNADGFDDLAIGGPGMNNREGRIWVSFGSRHGLDRNGAKQAVYGQASLGADEQGDEFGWSLAAGDLDGDGADDLAVGAPGEKPGSAPRAGFVFLFRGQLHQAAGPAALVPWVGVTQRSADQQDGDRFGEALAVGSLSSSSRADLVVGAPNDLGTGSIAIYYSAAHAGTGAWLPGRTLRPSALTAGANFGRAISIGRYGAVGSGAAARIAVGAPLQQVGSAVRAGAVFLMHDALSTPEASVFGAADNWLGSALGSLEVPGIAALVIGGDGRGNPGVAGAKGVVKIQRYDGTNAFTTLQTVSQTSLSPDEVADLYGAAFATGDFDRDGAVDLAIGAPGEAPGPDPASGQVFVYRGSKTSTGRVSGWVAYSQED